MTECTEREIQGMLPDVLHGTIVPGQRSRVDAHLAVCGQCRAELKVLREVHGAAVFAPSIDVDRIVRQIPPYGGVTPSVERRAPSRTVGWLVAASLVVLVAVGGSLLVRPSDVSDSSWVVGTPVAPAGQSLALATGVDELSDGGLAQLISELDSFDALPATELDPVFDVDTNAVEQDSL
ncbi:MAG TPA: zf-HC2 domain-containing protein [Gemmatimonadaceae bacterium]|nr:zf-HC2 domain-containing protein [Gemmatimonadaceae bacterium]